MTTQEGIQVMRGMRVLAMAALMATTGIATAMAGDNNDLFMEQVGSQNFGNGTQTGNNNESMLLSTGNNNTISTPVSGLRNDLYVNQEGNQNYVASRMDGAVNSDNRIVVDQLGNGNTVDGPNNQGAGSEFGNNNTFASNQIGDNNLVYGGESKTYNVGLAPVSRTSPDIATLVDGPVDGPISGHSRMSGDDNTVLLDQTGSDNVLALNVDGNRNSILGSGAGTPTLVGIGLPTFFNSPGGDTYLGTDDASTAYGGYAGGYATQQGMSNAAHLTQNGDDHTIIFDQIGNHNAAQVYQSGSGNLAIAVQQ